MVLSAATTGGASNRLYECGHTGDRIFKPCFRSNKTLHLSIVVIVAILPKLTRQRPASIGQLAQTDVSAIGSFPSCVLSMRILCVQSYKLFAQHVHRRSPGINLRARICMCQNRSTGSPCLNCQRHITQALHGLLTDCSSRVLLLILMLIPMFDHTGWSLRCGCPF